MPLLPSDYRMTSKIHANYNIVPFNAKGGVTAMEGIKSFIYILSTLNARRHVGRKKSRSLVGVKILFRDRFSSRSFIVQSLQYFNTFFA